jgi:hypothetical protein
MQKGEIIVSQLVPADQHPSKAIHPTMRAFHHPAARFGPHVPFEGWRFFPTCADVGREAKLPQRGPHFLIVVALVQTYPLGALLSRGTTTLVTVCFTHFISCRLAPATTKPRGTPCASVNTLRLTPLLARSVGLGPVFFPPEGRLAHRSIHTQPPPVQPLQFLELLDARAPQLPKHPRRGPLLEPIMRRGMPTQLGGV